MSSVSTVFRPARGLLLAFLLLLAAGCGGSAPLLSSAPTQAMVMDGDEADWAGVIQPLEGQEISLGVLNDGEFLYVGMLTTDPTLIRQIALQGLTVWFSEDGGEEKDWGIRYPLGLIAAGGPMRDQSRLRDEEQLRARFMASLQNLEIMQAGEVKGLRRPAKGVPGLFVGANLDRGMLFYEVKVPLQTTGAFDYAVGAAPGTTMGLGLETPEIDREEMREQMGDRGDDFGGMGGNGGLGRGNTSGRPPAGGRTLPERLDVWRTVNLIG